MTRASWLRRHPLTGYFGLAFAVSWGGILVVLGVHDLTPASLGPGATALIFVLMLLGPPGSGLALTAWTEGTTGLHALWAALKRARAKLRWYAIALLTVPILLLSILWPLSVFLDPAFSPGSQWHLLAAGFAAGAFEEIGWTGFATRRLLKRHRVMATGLGIGVLWGLWHLLVAYTFSNQALGRDWFLEFVVIWIAPLTAYRLLMTWVYSRSRSLPVAIAMHASYTGWLLVLYPTTSFKDSLLWQSAFAVLLWIAAALAIRMWMRSGIESVLPAHDLSQAPTGGPGR